MKRTYIEVSKEAGERIYPSYYWHIRAANGRIIAQGEGHPTRDKAIRAAEGVVRAVIGPGRMFDLLTFTRGEHKGVTRIDW